MNDEQVKSFRESLVGVERQTEELLSAGIKVDSQVAETADGHQGVVLITTGGGQMRFDIDPTEEMFKDGSVENEKVDEMSADIAATIVQAFLQQTNFEGAAAR